MSLGDGTVVSVGSDASLGRTHLRSGRFDHLADLGVRPAAAYELCREPAGSLLIAAHYGDGPGKPMVLGRVSLVARRDTQVAVAASAAGGVLTPSQGAPRQLTLDLDARPGRPSRRRFVSVRARAPRRVPATTA